MSSPFAAFQNATLRFEVASGTLTPDSKGNLRPGKAVVEVAAMLEEARSPETENRPGVDTTSIYMEGFAVSPMQIPSVVTPDSPCAAVWVGRQGKFSLRLTARSPWGYEVSTGDAVRGWFTPSSFVITGEPWTPSPNAGGTGDTLEAETDEAATAGQPLYLKSNGHVALASASAIGTARVAGLAITTETAGNSISYSSDGVLVLEDWTPAIGSTLLTPGATYFLSASAGRLTTTAPTEPGQVVIAIGSAASTTQLTIEIQPPILL